MSQNLNLGKSVYDLGYAAFVSRLKQKAAENGTHVIKVDMWFPSSKLCNNCGFKNRELGLQDRKWICPNCGTELSRDENAARNLRNVGLEILGLGKPSKLLEKVIAVGISVSTQSSVKQEAYWSSANEQVTSVVSTNHSIPTHMGNTLSLLKQTSLFRNREE